MALTRSQIKNKINNLTRQKNNYVGERDKYKNCVSYANKLLNTLKNSNNYLNTSNDYLKSFFTINGKTADNGKINNTKQDIEKIIKSLNNTIIPEINSNINNLNIKINNIDKEIRNLRRQLETAEN